MPRAYVVNPQAVVELWIQQPSNQVLDLVVKEARELDEARKDLLVDPYRLVVVKGRVATLSEIWPYPDSISKSRMPYAHQSTDLP